MPDKASDPLLAQLAQTLEKDSEQREDLIKRIKVCWRGVWWLFGSLEAQELHACGA
jgi:hypothetical protein